MAVLQGNWVWYELVTGDPAGAKAFYEAVVGWRIALGTGPPMNYGTIANDDGNELLAPSQAEALDFYTGLFGSTLPEPLDMGPMGKYQFIDRGGEMIGAIMQQPAQAQRSAITGIDPQGVAFNLVGGRRDMVRQVRSA